MDKHCNTYNWAEQLFLCVQPCLRVWVAAGTWARTMWFIQGLFLSKPPSIYSVLTLVLMRRKGLTYIYHFNCCENLDNLLTNTRTRLPALPASLVHTNWNRHFGWEFFIFLQCIWRVQRSVTAGTAIVSEAQNTSACARSLLARRGLAPSLVRV